MPRSCKEGLPRGLPPTMGTYVHYRDDELLAIVALESVRAKAVVIQHVRRADPNAQTMILFTRLTTIPGAAAATLHTAHVGLWLNAVTKPFVMALHKKGLIVFAYTCNRPAEISTMTMLGVGEIISDFPDLV